MESIGDEKRIRALFSEVRLADEQGAPSFIATWHRARSRATRPRRAFKFSIVTVTALLIFAIAGLAVWSRYSQLSETKYSAIATIPASSFAPPASRTEIVVDTRREIKPSVTTSRPRPATRRNAMTLAANRKAEQQAKELAGWQSPTSSLLASPSDGLFKSLPQLNENANDMKSFLPNRSNDKEK